MITQLLKRSTSQLLALVTIVFIMSSCEKDIVQIDKITDIPMSKSVQIVDKNYFKSIEEEYLSTDKSALTKSYATFHNTLSDLKKFESQEDFELAAMLVNMKAELSNGEIPVHENLKNLDFDYSTPDLASFFNHEGKLIVENTLYHIINEREQTETNLLTNEVSKTSIVEFEESTAKDDPTYEYKMVSYKKPGSSNPFNLSGYTYLSNADYHITVYGWDQTPVIPGYGNLVKFQVECMQRVWKSWGCRKGRAETNLTHFWYTQSNHVQANSSTAQEFCGDLYELKAEVFNPREDGEGEGCRSSRADCRRDKNTGVTSKHYVLINGTQHMYLERD